MLRRGGTRVLNGLPPGEFPVSIFDVVLNGYTLRGSIVGTRIDPEEALAFAADGMVKATIETQPLEAINDVFARLKQGKVNGRVVLEIGSKTLKAQSFRAEEEPRDGLIVLFPSKKSCHAPAICCAAHLNYNRGACMAQRTNASTLVESNRRSKMKQMNSRFSILAVVCVMILIAPATVRAQNAAATYKAKCSGCHGADGKGNTAPGKALGAHDFGSDDVTTKSDADLVIVVTAGKNKMPAYGKSLKETDIKDLVAYVRELGKQK
jgi:cytochrome c5